MRTTIAEIGVWAGVVAPILFFIVYTNLIRWWKTPSGRSFIAMDIALWVLFAQAAVRLVWPGLIGQNPLEWTDACVAVVIPAVILYRTTALAIRWHRTHQPGTPSSLVVQISQDCESSKPNTRTP